MPFEVRKNTPTDASSGWDASRMSRMPHRIAICVDVHRLRSGAFARNDPRRPRGNVVPFLAHGCCLDWTLVHTQMFWQERLSGIATEPVDSGSCRRVSRCARSASACYSIFSVPSPGSNR
jgi:hypothetical protein